MRIGIIGCGNFSETYFENQKLFNSFQIIACEDLKIYLVKVEKDKIFIKL